MSWVPCSITGGTTTSPSRTKTATTPANTTETALGRLIPRFVSDSTRGLIARVRKSDTTSRVMTAVSRPRVVPELEGDEHPERTDEADVEGRLAVQRPPGAAEPLAGGASRSSVASGAPSCPLLT